MIPPLKVELARHRSGHGLLELLQPQENIAAAVEDLDPAVKASAIEAAPGTAIIGTDSSETSGKEDEQHSDGMSTDDH